MSRNKGNVPFSGSYEPQVAQPFDARMVVGFVGDLTNEETWQALDDVNYAYPGLLTVVTSDLESLNGAYRLKALPITKFENWEKLGAGDGSSLLGYTESISNDMLTDGKCIIEHNIGTSDVIVSIKDNVNDLINPDNINVIDENSVEIDISSFIPIVDQYRVTILSSAAINIDSLTTAGLQREYTYDDAVNGVLNVYHNLGSEGVIGSVFNKDGEQVLPKSFIVSSPNRIDIDTNGIDPTDFPLSVVITTINVIDLGSSVLTVNGQSGDVVIETEKPFDGTQDEWDALTPDEKLLYTIAYIYE